MHPIIENKKQELIKLCKTHGVIHLYSFGSINTPNFRPDSDIDFLIDFNDDLSIIEYKNNYFSLFYKLQEIFRRNIDLITEKSLSNPYFIEELNETKELIYG